MILTVSFEDGWWTGTVSNDGELLIRSHPERRLGCAVRNLLNSLEHKYSSNLTTLVIDLEEW